MKKLLCTVIAFILLSGVFFIHCYAEETTPNGDEVNAKTPLEIAINAVTDFSDWKNGRIDHDTYASRAKENWLAAGYNTTEVFGVNDLMKLLDSCGVDVDGYWDTWKKETLKGYHDIDEQGILQGYGAMCTYYDSVNKCTHYYYCEYINFYPQNGIKGTDGQGKVVVSFKGSGKHKGVRSDGTSYFSALPSGGLYFRAWETDTLLNFAMYGDVRTIGEDNTGVPIGSDSNKLPDLPSDLNDTDLLRFIDDLHKKVQNYNFDNVQDSLNNIGLQLGDIIAKLGDIKVSVDIAYDGLTTDDFTIKLTPVQLEIVELKNLWESRFTFISQFQEVFKLVKWSDNSSLSIPFDFNGSSNAIDLSMFNPIINTVRIMLCAFIYIAYAVRQFKRMPSIIGGENSD